MTVDYFTLIEFFVIQILHVKKRKKDTANNQLKKEKNKGPTVQI